MFLIPREWFVDLKNEEEVYSLLDSIATDLHLAGYSEKQEEFVYSRLKELGETEILQKLETGHLILA